MHVTFNKSRGARSGLRWYEGTLENPQFRDVYGSFAMVLFHMGGRWGYV